MPLSMSEATNKDKVLAEGIKGMEKRAAEFGWTAQTFQFNAPPQHWFLTLKARSTIKVEIKFVTGVGYVVYLVGTLEKGGAEARTRVGTLPGSG
jgi:hypothetical protein